MYIEALGQNHAANQKTNIPIHCNPKEVNIVKTRKQYLNHECSFSEYYSQFVDNKVHQRVLQSIGKERLSNSTDEHLNDIPLAVWDTVLSPFPKYIGDKMRECGDFPTMAGAVCIAKTAARELIT